MNTNEAIYEYCLRLGDTSLILAHRLSELCGHGPILEEDIAMQNIALDLVGQSRIILSYAAQIEGKGKTEDDLAYLRDAFSYRNLLMAEQPNTDFAHTMVRQFFMSAYQYFLYTHLHNSADETIKGFAQKSLKETIYHLRHSTDWILRLGDGTDESNMRTQAAVDELQQFIDDLFDADEVDAILLQQKIGADMEQIKKAWHEKVKEVFALAKIKWEPANGGTRKGSRRGIHTEYLGYILAEMQWLQRVYPGNQW